MFRFRSLATLALFIGSAACSGSSRAHAPSAAGDRDDFGDAIPIALAPSRIVSLNPTTTEILFAIGAGDRLVGRSQYDLFPAAAARVPSVGPALRPNVEAVLGARPNLVILYASDDNRPALARLRGAGIPTVGFKIDRIDQFARDTRLLGRLVNDSTRANALVDSVTATIARVRQTTAALPHPRVLVPTWDRPVIVIGGGSYLTELLDAAGARNVYADAPAASLAVTLEDIVRRHPDIVLATPEQAATMRTSALWQAVPAVRAGRILVYDTAIVSRPSVTLGEAARSLADLIHPGAVR